MVYAMATMVSPKAKDTPSNPIPTCGNAAARTALPHPPSTSQKVPMNSAASFLVNGMADSCLFEFSPSYRRKVSEMDTALNLTPKSGYSLAITVLIGLARPAGARTVELLRRGNGETMLSILVCHSYFLRLDQKQIARAKPYPPLATLQVVSLLREAGHQVTFFDAMLAEGIDEYDRHLQVDRPQVVLFYEDNFNFL